MITLLSLAMACALDTNDGYKTPRQCIDKIMDVVEYIQDNPRYAAIWNVRLSGCPEGPTTNKQAFDDARLAGRVVAEELIKGLSRDYKKGNFHWMVKVDAGDAYMQMLGDVLANKWRCKK